MVWNCLLRRGNSLQSFIPRNGIYLRFNGFYPDCFSGCFSNPDLSLPRLFPFFPTFPCPSFPLPSLPPKLSWWETSPEKRREFSVRMASLSSKKSQNSRAPEKAENLRRWIGNDVQNHGNVREEHNPGKSGLGILLLDIEEP